MNTIWIARDKNNSLFMYSSKPTKDIKNNRFNPSRIYESIEMYTFEGMFRANMVKIPDNMYPEVTWENSPIELSTNL